MSEINVILRRDDNTIYNVLKINYDSKKYNTLQDISNYLKEKHNVECFYYECVSTMLSVRKNLFIIWLKKQEKLN